MYVSDFFFFLSQVSITVVSFKRLTSSATEVRFVNPFYYYGCKLLLAFSPHPFFRFLKSLFLLFFYMVSLKRCLRNSPQVVTLSSLKNGIFFKKKFGILTDVPVFSNNIFEVWTYFFRLELERIMISVEVRFVIPCRIAHSYFYLGQNIFCKRKKKILNQTTETQRFSVDFHCLWVSLRKLVTVPCDTYSARKCLS